MATPWTGSSSIFHRAMSFRHEVKLENGGNFWIEFDIRFTFTCFDTVTESSTTQLYKFKPRIYLHKINQLPKTFWST